MMRKMLLAEVPWSNLAVHMFFLYPSDKDGLHQEPQRPQRVSLQVILESCPNRMEARMEEITQAGNGNFLKKLKKLISGSNWFQC